MSSDKSALYEITNWDGLYENSRSREVQHARFFILRNKFDGDGYTELVDCENAAAVYGAWCALLGVASKSAPRGKLVRSDGRPHTAKSLARITRLEESAFAVAIERAINVGWITVSDYVDTSSADHRQNVGTSWRRAPLEENRREGKGTEEKRTLGASAPVNSAPLVGGQPNSKKEGRPSASSPASGDSDAVAKPVSLQEFVERWNAFVDESNKRHPDCKLAKVRVPVTDKLGRKIRTRLKDPDWFDVFLQCLKKLPVPLVDGKHRGWQPDLHWLVENDDRADYVVSGRYDFRAKPKKKHQVASLATHVKQESSNGPSGVR